MSSPEPSGWSVEELRAAIRSVLRDVLPAAGIPTPGGQPLIGESGTDGAIEAVRVGDDGELNALVRRIAALCEEPAQRAALRDGRRRYRLLQGADAPATPRRPGAGDRVLRVEQGAVTERRVQQAANEGARLMIGRRAVLTPLARDRVRTLGVVVERER